MGIFPKRLRPFDKEDSPSSPKGKVIAFLNQKGGVGKTTMAFNTAHALAEKGHKVLCLDLDPQANLSLLFEIDLANSTKQCRPSMNQLLLNSVRELKALHAPMTVQEAIVKTRIKKKCLDIIPAAQELSGFELSVAGITSPRQLVLKNFLNKNNLLDHYDYIIIDGPPTLGLLVVNILCVADGVFVPFRPDEFSRKGLGHFYEVIENVQDMGVVEAPTVLGYIPNLVDIRRRQEEDDLLKIRSELEKQFGEGTVLEPFFNRAPLVKSQAMKKSVYEFGGSEFKLLQGQFDCIAGRIHQWKESYAQ